MKAKPDLAAGFLMLIAGCNSQEVETTQSVLTPPEVAGLNIRARANDIEALKKLQLHYDFEQADDKREEIHQKLFQLNDPDAIEMEATRLISLSKTNTAEGRKRKAPRQCIGARRTGGLALRV